MPYPSAPEILTSYTAQEQALGDGTLPGQELDVDLAAIRASITSVIEFMKEFTRSDGQLANGSVTSDTLASSLIIGFDPPAPWETATDYTTRSTVFEGFGFYLALQAHTSTDFATDLASGRWVLLADLTPPGGALIASNSLSDLPNVPNARSNLGLGTMATANSGTGAAQHRTNQQNDAVFQPLNANLTAEAGLAGVADRVSYFTGAGSKALATFTAAGRALVDDVDAAAQRTTLGLVIGTNVQAQNANLASLAGITLSAGDILYATGANTLQRLAIGTATQQLRVNAGGTALEYFTPSVPSGGATLLATVPTTSGGSQSATGLDLTGYKSIRIVFRCTYNSGGTGNLLVAGVSVYQTANNADVLRGTAWVDLTDGTMTSAVAPAASSGAACFRKD